MAGDYQVNFDFLEIETFQPDKARDKPYQSWATERVYVDADKGTYISLVHILDMRIVQDDGTLSDPIVTKHWRQSWQYEPARDRGVQRSEPLGTTQAEPRGTYRPMGSNGIPG